MGVTKFAIGQVEYPADIQEQLLKQQTLVDNERALWLKRYKAMKEYDWQEFSKKTGIVIDD